MVIERVVPLAAERRSALSPLVWLGRVRLWDPHKCGGSASTDAYDFRSLGEEKLAFGLAALCINHESDGRSGVHRGAHP